MTTLTIITTLALYLILKSAAATFGGFIAARIFGETARPVGEFLVSIEGWALNRLVEIAVMGRRAPVVRCFLG